MSEEGADFALWGDEAQSVEDDLDIPNDLRVRMKSWAREYTDQVNGVGRRWTAEDSRDHDRRGYRMSVELQAVLGDAYFVTYFFNTAEVRAEVRRAEAER